MNFVRFILRRSLLLQSVAYFGGHCAIPPIPVLTLPLLKKDKCCSLTEICQTFLMTFAVYVLDPFFRISRYASGRPNREHRSYCQWRSS